MFNMKWTAFIILSCTLINLSADHGYRSGRDSERFDGHHKWHGANEWHGNPNNEWNWDKDRHNDEEHHGNMEFDNIYINPGYGGGFSGGGEYETYPYYYEQQPENSIYFNP